MDGQQMIGYRFLDVNSILIYSIQHSYQKTEFKIPACNSLMYKR